MPARPLSAVPNIFTSEGTGTLNNIPLLDQDFATLVNQGNDSAIGYNNYGVDMGTANAYVVALAAPPSGYVAGMTLSMKVLNSNTGPSVINVNSVGSVSILMNNGGALVGAEMTAGSIATMVFNGTNFVLVDSAPVVAVNLGTIAVTTNVVCLGASSVTVVAGIGTTGVNVTLQQIGIAVPVFLYITNPQPGSLQFGIMATNPQSTSLVVQAKGPGGTIFAMSSTGATLAPGSINMFWGSTTGSSVVLLAL